MVDYPRVPVAEQDVHLENEPSKQEWNEDHEYVDEGAHRSMNFMCIQKPPYTDKSCRHFYKKKHHAEYDSEIHEGECADEGYKGYHMVPDHLFIEKGERPLQHYYVECVLHKVSTCVHERPYVQVAGCVEAFLAVEDGDTVAAYEEHGQRGEDDRDDRMHRADYVCAVFHLLYSIKLDIALVTS